MMLLFLLSKRKPCSIPLPFFSANRTIHRCFSANPDLNFSVHNYLIASFGFSPDKAGRVSKSIAHLKSPEKPDSVCGFLEKQGFTKSDMKTLISRDPGILCSSPEKTLQPNLHALRTMGLSTPALTEILLTCPQALQLHLAPQRIKFWRDFLGGDESDLIKALKFNKSLVHLDIDNNIQPKIAVFQSHGLSTYDIRRIVLVNSRFILSSVSGMGDVVKRTKEMGFQPGSGMFMQGLLAMACVNRDALQKKMELLKGFGWLEDEFFSAVRRAPRWVFISEKNLQEKMDFLMGEARCDPSYIASNPLLLAFSLEKRLRPRLKILHLLESKGLYSKAYGFYYVISMTDSDFVRKFILPNKADISGFHEAYFASCGRDSEMSKIPRFYVDSNGDVEGAQDKVSQTIDCSK